MNLGFIFEIIILMIKLNLIFIYLDYCIHWLLIQTFYEECGILF